MWGQNLVFSQYADDKTTYPLGFRLYEKEADSKVDLAKALVDEAHEVGVPANTYLFDSWYCSQELVEHVHQVARFEGTPDEKSTKASLRDADRDLRALERRGLTIRVAPWRLAGEVKADGDISLADANAVALAVERDATLLVGADDDFADLPLDVDLSQFRADSA